MLHLLQETCSTFQSFVCKISAILCQASACPVILICSSLLLLEETCHLVHIHSYICHAVLMTYESIHLLQQQIWLLTVQIKLDVTAFIMKTLIPRNQIVRHQGWLNYSLKFYLKLQLHQFISYYNYNYYHTGLLITLTIILFRKHLITFTILFSIKIAIMYNFQVLSYGGITKKKKIQKVQIYKCITFVHYMHNPIQIIIMTSLFDIHLMCPLLLKNICS